MFIIISDDIVIECYRMSMGFGHHGHHFHDMHSGFVPAEVGMGMGFGLRRGEFRYLILIILNENPMHGYALIKEIGRRYQRAVSAGLVYPTLQELEDMDLVSLKEREGKKIYSITTEGKNYLKRNQDIVDRLKAGQEYAGKIGQFGFMRDLRDIQSMLMTNADLIDEGKVAKIQDVLVEMKRKVSAIVFE